MQREETKEVLVPKKIKHLENPNLGKLTRMKNFVLECQKELDSSSFEEKIVVIKKPEHLPALEKAVEADQLQVKNLSFDISKKDIANIVNQLLAITTDPLCVISLLKELETELATAIQKAKIPFGDNERPQFLIPGQGTFIPGPPPDDYHPKKKERILYNLLLEREQKNGINKEGAPKFVGAVDSKHANPLVASGYIFTEDKQISSLLSHGSLSHRLMFDALCCAVKNGKLNLQYGEGKELTPQQLLELLVSTSYYTSELDRDPDNLWELTLDTVADTVMTTNDLHKTDDYNFSCRSPYVLNSLLLCFGKEVGLPNLERVLLDSYWKAAYEMVNRVKNTPGAENIPESRIYTKCMEAFSTSGEAAGSIDVIFPFTLDEKIAQANPRYKPFAPTLPPSIVKKERVAGPTGEYTSWNEFSDAKNLASTKSEIQTPPLMTDQSKLDISSDVWEDILKSIENNSPKVLMDILGKCKHPSPKVITHLYNAVVKYRAYECLNVLMRYGLNVNAVDEYEKKTALTFAKERGDYEGMLMLVKAGAKEYLPSSNFSIATVLSAIGINKSAPSPNTLMIKELSKGIKNIADKKLVEDMEHQLSARASKQQLAVILLDYVERHKRNLSPTMHTQVNKIMNLILSESELSVLNTPPQP